MKNNYLNKSKKEYYMNDFNFLLKLKDDFWGLDKGLKKILTHINCNENIQTLYSKFSQGKDANGNQLSYLEFCYTSKIELELFRNTIPFFINKYNTNSGDKCYYLFNKPIKNENYIKHAIKTGLACLDDENYFLINNIGIYLNSNNIKTHKLFWKDIELSF
ncbi:MAG: hypothetical protein WCK02_14255 [Bacteroidota bacterium]